MTSTNERAEALMGRRPTDCIAFDQPVELGYWCPTCRVDGLDEQGEMDERLHWSEYQGFIWCDVCDFDYPSALCVPIDGVRDPNRPWAYAGRDDAVRVYLDSVEFASKRLAEAAPAASSGDRPLSAPWGSDKGATDG